jgi:hypothetical protein
VTISSEAGLNVPISRERLVRLTWKFLCTYISLSSIHDTIFDITHSGLWFLWPNENTKKSTFYATLVLRSFWFLRGTVLKFLWNCRPQRVLTIYMNQFWNCFIFWDRMYPQKPSFLSKSHFWKDSRDRPKWSTGLNFSGTIQLCEYYFSWKFQCSTSF